MAVQRSLWLPHLRVICMYYQTVVMHVVMDKSMSTYVVIFVCFKNLYSRFQRGHYIHTAGSNSSFPLTVCLTILLFS